LQGSRLVYTGGALAAGSISFRIESAFQVLSELSSKR
jgi:hypothetical protein